MKKKITLIIVDFQKDFSNVIGKLYVAGAENARKAIIAFIKKNAEFIGEVIFTVDWHTANHCSFKANGNFILNPLSNSFNINCPLSLFI
jgi:nicotinamidase-related amidase